MTTTGTEGRASVIDGKPLTRENVGAPGGIRTPNLLIRSPRQGLLESLGPSIYGGTWPTASVTGQRHRCRVAVRAAVNRAMPDPCLIRDAAPPYLARESA